LVPAMRFQAQAHDTHHHNRGPRAGASRVD